MSQETTPVVDPQVEQEKQRNFAELRKIAEQERSARLAAEERLAAYEKQKSASNPSDDDEDDEPYVDRKKLNKKLNQFGEQVGQQTSALVKNEVEKALREERKAAWFNNNPDFQKVMTPEILNRFEKEHKEIANSILNGVPDEFERQKLAYANIKALRLDQPPLKEPTAQEKINQNRRHPGFQPSGEGMGQYNPQGDFSKEGQQKAYEKMQEWKQNMRI